MTLLDVVSICAVSLPDWLISSAGWPAVWLRIVVDLFASVHLLYLSMSTFWKGPFLSLLLVDKVDWTTFYDLIKLCNSRWPFQGLRPAEYSGGYKERSPANDTSVVHVLSQDCVKVCKLLETLSGLKLLNLHFPLHYPLSLLFSSPRPTLILSTYNPYPLLFAWKILQDSNF